MKIIKSKVKIHVLCTKYLSGMRIVDCDFFWFFFPPDPYPDCDFFESWIRIRIRIAIFLKLDPDPYPDCDFFESRIRIRILIAIFFKAGSGL